jgi:type IV secretory pathway protease TraF
MALLLAEHPGSFDSRYFGLVPLDSLRLAKAVWIWK